MKLNIGSVERIVRAALGPAIAGDGLTFTNWFGLIAPISSGTAAAGWCRLSAPFGLSTNRLPSERSSS